MDKKVFRDVSYGMYFVGSSYNDNNAGCVINTFSQINSVDPLISISLNKDNYTNKIIKSSEVFSVSIISIDNTKEIISKFGYYSSLDIDKFSNINYEIVNEVPVVIEDVCSYVICEVNEIIDCETHDLIIARVISSKKISDRVPMTYKYYQEHLKGISPKNAPTYEEKTINSGNGLKYKCKLCGYIYDDSKEAIKFSELADDWVCPLCGATKDMFEAI